MKPLLPFCLASLALATSAQSTKLTPPFGAGLAGGDAQHLTQSPDGRWIFYLADENRAGAVQAYAVPADGSRPTVLVGGARAGSSLIDPTDVREVVGNIGSTHVLLTRYDNPQGQHTLSPLPRLDGHGKVRGAPQPAEVSLGQAIARFSPDGKHLALLEYSVAPASSVLSLVPPGGLHRKRLINDTNFPSLPTFSNDGRWLAYLQGTGSIVMEVVLVDLSDTAPGRVIGTSRFDPIFSPDSKHILYRDVTLNEVFVAALEGPFAPFPLALNSATVDSIRVDPTSTHAVVATGELLDPYTFVATGIHVAPLDGSSSAHQISVPLPTGRQILDYAITPDGAKVVYWANSSNSLDSFLLHVVPIAGGAVRTYSGGSNIGAFRLTRDSNGIVFQQGTSLFYRSFGGNRVTLSTSVSAFELCPDGTTVVYRSDRESAQTHELWRVPVTGGASAKLSGPLPPGGSVTANWLLTADGGRVAYIADGTVDGEFEVYSVPIDGGPPVTLSGPLDPGTPTGDAGIPELSHDKTRVFFPVSGCPEQGLYTVPVSGGTAVRLHPQLPQDRSFLGPATVPSGLVFLADPEQRGKLELHHAPADASHPSVKLSHAFSGTAFEPGLLDFELSPSGDYVVYRTSSSEARVGLHATRTDRTGTPVPLSLPGQSTKHCTPIGCRPEYAVTADDAYLVYRSDADLWSVPLVGGVAPRRLNQSIAAGGRIGTPTDSTFIVRYDPTFLLSPDGSHALYAADVSGGGKVELYSVPVDGSRAPIKLSAQMVALGDVQMFFMSPDGTRALYVADASIDLRYELFSVPLDGSLPPVTLSLPVPEFSRPEFASTMHFSPDGTLAFLDQGRKLYLVPVDGSAPPRLLVDGGIGNSLVARGDRVLFSKRDQNLYAMPIDGSSAEVKLNTPLVLGGVRVSQIASWDLSPDGRTALYVTDERLDGRSELFARPCDGTRPAVVLSGPVLHNGSVQPVSGSTGDFSMSADRIVYTSSQDQATVSELYSSPLP